MQDGEKDNTNSSEKKTNKRNDIYIHIQSDQQRETLMRVPGRQASPTRHQ